MLAGKIHLYTCHQRAIEEDSDKGCTPVPEEDEDPGGGTPMQARGRLYAEERQEKWHGEGRHPYRAEDREHHEFALVTERPEALRYQGPGHEKRIDIFRLAVNHKLQYNLCQVAMVPQECMANVGE